MVEVAFNWFIIDGQNIQNWIDANVIGHYIEEYSDVYLFELEEDAIFFKLRWS